LRDHACTRACSLQDDFGNDFAARADRGRISALLAGGGRRGQYRVFMSFASDDAIFEERHLLEQTTSDDLDGNYRAAGAPKRVLPGVLAEILARV